MDLYSTLALLIVLVFALATSVLVLLKLRQHRLKQHRALPDGDYVVSVEQERETLEGSETVYVVESPKEFKEQRIVVKHSK